MRRSLRLALRARRAATTGSRETSSRPAFFMSVFSIDSGAAAATATASKGGSTIEVCSKVAEVSLPGAGPHQTRLWLGVIA